MVPAASSAPPASASRSCATSCRPTAAACTSRARPVAARASRSSCHGADVATLLIVDDEPNIRTHLATYARSLGHAVEVAQDGAEALAKLEHRPADLVFS